VTLWDSKQRGGQLSDIMGVQVLTSSLGGRPDVMKLLQEVYTSWCAEVVFITSNFQGNKEIMEGCKIAGIPAFVSHIPAPVSDNENLLNTWLYC
jgi:hypothetical protein